jgi:integrase
MPKLLLTDPAIRGLRPPPKGQVFYRDKTLPGFGVRVSQGGSKTFVLVHGANRQSTTIGRYPILSLSEARTEAKRFLAEKTLGKMRRVSITFGEAQDRFIKACEAKNKPRTIYDYKRVLDRHFKFGKTRLDDIHQHELMRRILKLSATPAEQNYAFVTAKLFFRWAKKNNYIETSPLADLSIPAKTHARERVLTPRELVTVYTASQTFSFPFGHIVSLLILTGLRRGEVGSLQWGYIDRNERIITIPNTETKNKRTHIIPYGEKVASVLETVPEMSTYLFPARCQHIKNKPTTSFNGWSNAKTRFDKTFADDVAPYTLHDLRRTFDTTMASLNVPLQVTDKLLNHISGAISGVRATYNRYSYLPEMRDAITSYEKYLDGLCDGS